MISVVIPASSADPFLIVQRKKSWKLVHICRS